MSFFLWGIDCRNTPVNNEKLICLRKKVSPDVSSKSHKQRQRRSTKLKKLTLCFERDRESERKKRQRLRGGYVYACFWRAMCLGQYREMRPSFSCHPAAAAASNTWRLHTLARGMRVLHLLSGSAGDNTAGFNSHVSIQEHIAKDRGVHCR